MHHPLKERKIGLTEKAVKLIIHHTLQQEDKQLDEGKMLIEERQEAVTELIESINLYDDLCKLVGGFPNLEAVLSLCIKRVDHATNANRVDAKIEQMIGLRQVWHLKREWIRLFSCAMCR